MAGAAMFRAWPLLRVFLHAKPDRPRFGNIGADELFVQCYPGGQVRPAGEPAEKEIVMKFILTAVLASGFLATAAGAAEVTAQVRDRDGNDLGAVHVRDTSSGVAVATLTLMGLPEGIHAIHLHETGDCSGEGFESAGGHIARDRSHGVEIDGGPHPGDMPNLTVTSDSTGEEEIFLPFLEVERDLMDSDGAAFVIHEGVDDYESQPSGDAGGRIACGEFEIRE